MDQSMTIGSLLGSIVNTMETRATVPVVNVTLPIWAWTGVGLLVLKVIR